MNSDNTPLPDNPVVPKPGKSKSTQTDAGSILPDTAIDSHGPSGKGNPQLWIGKTLGKYQITGVLGQGGMGTVLKAFDPTIERDVAIKVLADHLAADPTALSRFLAEAKSAGKVNHANVMAIYEVCQDGPTNYLVLEYVPGGNLEQLLDKHERLSVPDATRAMMDACKGVGAAHAAGLIHRDIKPANFTRAADGTIKVADFGLAKGSGDSQANLTRTGMVVGTPFFMSPEQCQAQSLDSRTDIYSLGATYYSLLTGQHPYNETDNVAQLMYLHCHGPVPDPRAINPTIPEACSRIVSRAMAKSRDDRYQTAEEMFADLQAVYSTLSGQNQILLPGDSRVYSAAKGSMRWAYLALSAATILGAFAVYWTTLRNNDGANPTVALTGEPIKVGVLHSLNGTMTDSEFPVVHATLFAIAQINQSGGVMGREVRAVVADGRSEPRIFDKEAERLILEERVCTVFGCWTSACRKTIKPIFEHYEHLLIYPVQFEGLEMSPNIFYLGPAPNQQILPAIDWAVKTLGKKKFFLVGSDYVYPRAAHAIIREHVKKLGAEIVGEEYIPMSGRDAKPLIAKIKDAKPEMILNSINGDSNVTFFREMLDAGMKPSDVPVMSFSIGEQGLRSIDPTRLEGQYSAWTYFQSVDTPENAEFVSRFLDQYPQDTITDPMEAAYVGVKMWAAAANEAKSIEPKKIARALLNQRMRGPSGDVRIDADSHYCYRTPRIGQIQADGRFKVIWTAPAPVKPEAFPSNTRTAEAWGAFLNDLYVGWGNQWSAPNNN